jgi:hypothetical protein
MSHHHSLPIIIKIDGMTCIVRDGKKIVAMLEAMPGIRSANLMFSSRTVFLESDGSFETPSLESSALECIQRSGYSASLQSPEWSAVTLVGVNCITVARRVEAVLASIPGAIRVILHFPTRRLLLLSGFDAGYAVARAAEAGETFSTLKFYLFSRFDTSRAE